MARIQPRIQHLKAPESGFLRTVTNPERERRAAARERDRQKRLERFEAEAAQGHRWLRRPAQDEPADG